jgi:hypothetical protein
MATNPITNVTVYKFVRTNKPPLSFIRVEEVITAGKGGIEIALQGGTETVFVTLTSGHAHEHDLKDGEKVRIRGTHDGEGFEYEFDFTVQSAHRPWKFTGKS